MNKHTLVIGASTNPERYSHKAILQLTKHGNTVTAIGNKHGEVNGIQIHTQNINIQGIHTVTLYLNPTLQKAYYDYIISLNPQRIIFNPGTENPELEALAQHHAIKTLQACTLVLLSTSQY